MFKTNRLQRPGTVINRGFLLLTLISYSGQVLAPSRAASVSRENLRAKRAPKSIFCDVSQYSIRMESHDPFPIPPPSLLLSMI
jgi:hypothetical protein